MPNRTFALKDEREHVILHGQEGELCSLNLVPPAPFSPGGPFVVLATGELHSLEASFTVRLSVFRFGGPLAASEAYTVWSTPTIQGIPVILSNPLALTLTVELPGEGGGSGGAAPPTPQPRAAVALEAISSGGAGIIRNLRITAIQVDELHQTTIPGPPPPPEVAFEPDIEALVRKARERHDLEE